MILRKGQMLETEHMFREAGEKWPVIIPEELHQFFPGTKVWAFFSSGLVFNCCSLCSVGRGILSNNCLSKYIHYIFIYTWFFPPFYSAKESRREEAVTAICLTILLEVTLEDHKYSIV
ncbi:hypothetical protein Goarm_022324 [Gossypium armourianum]|uniref:Uncharacterized protein n=1 Tax=Gossypium armourianum TaxID=34283 RepID=A0A7J9KEI5_9ROSI|nr:hypothetical protein [Gossypium armourianum]